MAKKTDSRAFAQQRRRRREWLTFMRMVRYGINNFSRNTWLTVAATVVMTITLLIVFLTLVSRNVLVDTVAEIQSSVDMSIYVKDTTKQDAIDQIQSDLEELPIVTKVIYHTPTEARADFAEQHKDDPDTLQALNEAANTFPGEFRISVKDINDTSDLDNFVQTDKAYLASRDPDRAPTFAGDKRATIQTIGNVVSFAEKVGIVISIVFIVISSLIVFNTIRMAIFTRRDEIQMMKLIGAEPGFIRGPFVVEAIVYGFIAAVLATAAGLAVLYAAQPKLADVGIAVGNTVSLLTLYVGFVVLGMILLGAIIGIISALLATRKYLRI